MKPRWTKGLSLSSTRWFVMVGVLSFSLVALFGSQGWWSPSSWSMGSLSYLCPLGGLEVWLAGGGITLRSALGLLVAVVLIAVLGRFFCGWLCPTPLLKRLFTRQHSRRVIPIHPVSRSQVNVELNEDTTSSRLPYYGLLGVLGASVAFGFPVFCLICPVGISIALILGVGQLMMGHEVQVGLWVFALILAIEVFVLKRWCHALCPLGALMRLLARVNRFYLPKVDRERCLHGQQVDCHVCMDACPEGIDLLCDQTPKTLNSCTHCHACADACPAQAISLGFKIGSTKRPLNTATSFVQPRSFTQVTHEAQRCVLCGACEAACPQHQPITLWMKHLKAREFRQVAKLLLSPGQWPECSALCPSERLCERACAESTQRNALPIRWIEEQLGALGKQRGNLEWSIRSRAKSVAVVGAGPAGLTCAQVLSRHGVHVDLYERTSHPGGLLSDGIPYWKVPLDSLKDQVHALERAGVCFRYGVEVGQDIQYEDLIAHHDALFLAQGAQQAQSLSCALAGYEDGEGIIDALTYLSRVHSVRAHECGHDRTLSLTDKQVLILGGGDTMIDCVQGALCDHAKSVSILYHRDRSDMKCSEVTLDEILREGVVLYTHENIVSFERTHEGRLCAVYLTQGTRLPVDRVIVAYGFKVETNESLEQLGVRMTTEKGVQTLPGRLRTAHPKVYVGGDMHVGASLLSFAIGEGRQAGYEILSDLGIKGVKP